MILPIMKRNVRQQAENQASFRALFSYKLFFFRNMSRAYKKHQKRAAAQPMGTWRQRNSILMLELNGGNRKQT